MRARAAAVVALLFVATTARAGDAEDADALIAKGLDLREHGKDEEALALFRKAFAKSASPRGRAQIALAEQALGMWIDAERDLSSALASAQDGWIAKNRGALEGALATIRKHLGDLEIRGHDDGEVYLDGVRLGTTPGPFRVEAGRRTLEVRAKGFVTTTRAVDIPQGGVARETVRLVEETAPQGERTVTSISTASGERGASAQPTVGWTLVGIGGAALVFGVVGMLVRQGMVDDYNAACPGLGAAQTPDCNDQISSARSWLTISVVSLVAGGLVAGTGGVLVLTSPKSDVRAACGPFGCSGTF